jgi:hypothetical protein
MAGGVAPKGHALLVTALAKMADAKIALQQLSQSGNPALDSRSAKTDTAVAAAITALQALV